MEFNWKEVMSIGTIIVGFVTVGGIIYFLTTTFLGVGNQMASATGTTNESAVQSSKDVINTVTADAGKWMGMGIVIGIAGLLLGVFGISNLLNFNLKA